MNDRILFAMCTYSIARLSALMIAGFNLVGGPTCSFASPDLEGRLPDTTQL
jgi:hypothetical protein